MFKTSKNALILFSSDIISRVLGLLATVHVARVLKAENYGIIIIGFSFLFYSIWFSDLGLTFYGTREFAKPEDKRKVFLGELFFLKLILAIIVFVFSNGFISIFYSNQVYINVLKLFLLMLFSDAVLFEWYFKGIRKYFPILIYNCVSGLIYLLLVWFYIDQESHVDRIPVFYFFANFIGGLVIVFFKNREDKIFPHQIDFTKYINVIKSSINMGMGNLLANVIRVLPPLVLGFLYTSKEAGIFGAAMKIVTLTLIIDRVFSALFFPKITNVYFKQNKNISQIITVLLKLIITCGVSVSVVISICSEDIIQLIFGENYLAGKYVLIILSWFLVETLIGSVFSTYLMITGNEKKYFKTTLISGVTSFFTIILFSHFYGTVGAAIGVIVSEFLLIVFLYLEFRKLIKVKFVSSIISSVIISAIFMAMAFALDLTNIYFSPVIWLLFIGTAVLFKVIKKEDFFKIIAYETKP